MDTSVFDHILTEYSFQESTFRVDASQAGQGEVDVSIESNNRPIRPIIRSTGNGQYDVSFTPYEAGPHGINVKFVNRVIPGSPFKMNVHDPSQMRVSGDGLKRAFVGEMAWFEIDPRGGTAEASVKITSPTGSRVACEMTRSTRGIIRVEYTPLEVGPHSISCKYADTPLNGSPFTCQVIDPRMVKITDLKDGFVGKECKFMVDASMGGQGELDLEIEGNNRLVPHTVNSVGRGVYQVIMTANTKYCLPDRFCFHLHRGPRKWLCFIL